MGIFYFDESIHDRGGFIIGAFVFTADGVQERVRSALALHGLRPGIDEYKSTSKMAASPSLDSLRQELRHMLTSCSVALAVHPSNRRSLLGKTALGALKQFLRVNHLEREAHRVYLDEGIGIPPGLTAVDLVAEAGLQTGSQIQFGADSRSILGLQLADCAAHTAATILLEDLGLTHKEVAGRKSGGWDPLERYALGFELWAVMRHALFNGGLPPEPRGDNMFVDVHPFGLYIAPECSQELTEKVMKRFGTAYLGCIH